MFRCQVIKFPNSPFPPMRNGFFRTARSGQGRAVSARRSEPLTARTVLRRSTKRERRSSNSIRFLEAQQAIRLLVYLATIVLSERGTVPGGNVSGVRNRWHLTRLSELKWIRKAKAVESIAFHT